MNRNVCHQKVVNSLSDIVWPIKPRIRTGFSMVVLPDTIERKQASQFTWFKPALSKPVTNPKPQDEYLAEDVGGPTLKYAEPYGIGFQPNNGTIV